MVSVLSFGLRLVITIPTMFFLASQVLRYGLKARTKKELMESPQFKWSFASLGEKATREYRWEFFLDSAILSIVNGLILTFELARTEYGIALLIVGVVASLAGLVATELNAKSSVGFLIIMLIILFFSELAYFAVFGNVVQLVGIRLLPRDVFIIPLAGTLVFLLLILLLAVIVALARTRRSQQLPKRV